MSSNGRRRVVVTGVGAVTPLGNDAETTWQTLIAGESGAGPITQFDSTDYFVHFACEVKDFEPSVWIDRKQARRMDRFAQLILAAARQAEADSGIDIKADGDRDRRFDRHRDRWDQVLPGLLRHADLTRPRPREPVRDPLHHPEHGGGLGVDGARDTRAALVRVHGLRRVEHGDRPGPRRHPAGPSGRHALRRDRVRDQPGRHRRLRSDARAFAPERRPKGGPAAPSTRDVTAS